MANGSYIGLSAAVAAHKQLDVVANNLANVNTTGFKQQRLAFSHVLAEAGNNLERQEKGYVQVQGSYLNLEQGAITATHNALDVALHGDGFLVVRDGQDMLLTRNGAMALSPDGVLTDSLGRPVQFESNGENVEFNDQAKIEINEDGEVYQGETLMGKLRVVRCDPATLVAKGAATFASDPNTWQEAGNSVRVLSGHLESSNVNPISNLTKLIELNRSYQATQRVIDRYTKMDKRAIDTMG